MSSFKDLRIVDNFYQTSAFYPMPTILVGTLTESGKTNLGSYSLCFPYYIAERDYYAMILECRNSSNTAQNLLRSGVCSLNFITDEPRYFKETVRLGFPGETSEEKMRGCIFTPEKGLAEGKRPLVVAESYQVFECTWMRELDNAQDDAPGCVEGYEPPYHDFNGITSRNGAIFILRIDKILMKDKYHKAIIDGVKANVFPSVPVDWGYRDSTNFWYSRFRKPVAMQVPRGKEADLQSVLYAANRTDPDVKFTEDACKALVRVPRVFLKTVLNGCVEYAKAHDITLIDGDVMAKINEERRKSGKE